MLIALLLHVSLAFPPAVPPAVARAAIAEAADIWSPYGVAIALAAPCGRASDDSTVLNVVTVESGALPSKASTSGGWRAALGGIVFHADGTPATVVTVYLVELRRFIGSTRVLGANESQWPPALREEVLGRVLGRVLAHEVGHFLLRSPQHTDDGLMRSQVFVDDLVAPSRRRFTLSPVEAARLSSGPAGRRDPLEVLRND